VIFTLIFVSSLKFVAYSILDVSTAFVLNSSLRVIEYRRFERKYRIDLEVSRSRRSVTVITPHDFSTSPSSKLSRVRIVLTVLCCCHVSCEGTCCPE